MRKSIKRTVFIRVAAALLSILLFSGVTTFNLLRVEGMQERNAPAIALAIGTVLGSAGEDTRRRRAQCACGFGWLGCAALAD